MAPRAAPRDVARSALWVALYALLAFQPILVLLAAPSEGRGGFGRELSSALGFLALSTMTMQFALTARFQWLAPPFGTDLVYAFHRAMTWVSLGLAVLHPLALLGRDAPAALGWLTVAGAPPAIAAGVLALYALAALLVTSLFRRGLRLPYEPWRAGHGLLAVAALALGALHALRADRLLARPVERVAWLAWTLAWGLLIVRVRLAKPLVLLRRPWVVREVRPEGGRVTTLALEPDGHPGVRFRAGQFVWLTLFGSPFGAREHPFSISSSSQGAPRLELTVKEAGDFTRRVAAELRPGARAYVDGPFGSMTLDGFPDAEGYLLVAGGAGIAPCLSILRTLADRGDRRRHVLVYGTGRWEATPFRETLRELAGRLRLEVVHVLEHPPEGWRGERGLVTEEVLGRHLLRDLRVTCFVCGPPGMMDVVERALVRLGVPVGDIHSERFDLV
ncbi:ferredoxin reductase family protein [Anaeromyxobacter diazotrophicus]|uniref:FAD-binding FR-type domain-containing protein n=1 Tax=Anaeromyxobacter diazotrophicus TaxID=2590199 RepID=A0A7I9VL97_9BACT|nr:ferredoxin reductase family protein [Anaeromyxobacter diazotrophicus]GEJ56757.1 hypothetical protein AMYX_14980 [Anaeromyxobacter diazotrophicus]